MITKCEALLKLKHSDDTKWNRCEENSTKNRGVKIGKFNKETGEIEKEKSGGKRFNSKKYRGMNEYFVNLTYAEAQGAGIL